MCACSFAQSDSCDPKDCSPPGFSVHGISQAEILEWVAISFSRGFSQSMDWTCVSCIGRWLLYHWTTWEVLQKIEPETQVYMITEMESAIPGPQEWGECRARQGEGRGVQTFNLQQAQRAKSRRNQMQGSKCFLSVESKTRLILPGMMCDNVCAVLPTREANSSLDN